MCLDSTVMLQITVIWARKQVNKKKKKSEVNEVQTEWTKLRNKRFSLLSQLTQIPAFSVCTFQYRNVTKEILHLEAEQPKWKAPTEFLKEPHVHLRHHTTGHSEQN